MYCLCGVHLHPFSNSQKSRWLLTNTIYSSPPPKPPQSETNYVLDLCNGVTRLDSRELSIYSQILRTDRDLSLDIQMY